MELIKAKPKEARLPTATQAACFVLLVDINLKNLNCYKIKRRLTKGVLLIKLDIKTLNTETEKNK